jgi:hypothetical protein
MIRTTAAAAVLYLILQQVAAGAQPLFNREEVYSTPIGTYGMAAGDFNGDGWLDLATTNSSTEHNGGLGLTVYYNQQGAGFSGRTDYATGYRTFGITSADFNGDRLSDLAFATYYSQTISVMYATTGVGFSLPTEYTVSGSPWDVVTGDFNRDGILDLATNHYNVTVLSGIPAGGFGNKQLINTGTSGYGNLLTDDLNHDGYLDLAQTTGSGQSVQVLYGQSTGSFGPSQQFTVGPAADALATGDLNGDGRLDLAVTNWELKRITTLFGQSTGGFSEPHYYFVSVTPTALAIADLNGDGRSDLVVTQSSNSQGYLTLFLGQPSGLLAATESMLTYGSGKDVVVADFNKDGLLDIAATASTSNTNGASFSIFYQGIPEPSAGSIFVIGVVVVFSTIRHQARGRQ